MNGLPLAPKPHALVVDDDVAIRVLVTRILEGRRFIVDAARDGAEAIQKLAESSYAVVLLVIVMTAFGTRATGRLPTSRVRFVEKPFDIQTLVTEISECVEKAGDPAS